MSLTACLYALFTFFVGVVVGDINAQKGGKKNG